MLARSKSGFRQSSMPSPQRDLVGDSPLEPDSAHVPEAAMPQLGLDNRSNSTKADRTRSFDHSNGADAARLPLGNRHPLNRQLHKNVLVLIMETARPPQPKLAATQALGRPIFGQRCSSHSRR
jgi:hypothetical protein